LRPAIALYAWSTGQTWEKVVRLADMPEGNLAMLVLRTADNLRHIRTLVDAFPAVAENANKAVESILREPVVVEFS
jgi:ATP-dependent RNA helicase HelY